MTGLNLRKTPVLRQGQTGIKGAMEILQEVQEDVERMGLPEYPKPQGSPPPLGNLNPEELTNRDLEIYYTSYVSYAMYIAPKLAVAESSYKISSSNLSHIKANIEAQLYAASVPKSEVKTQVLNSPIWQEQELEHLKLFATKTILEAHYKAYSKQAQALSRIVELRKLEFEAEQRSNGIGGFKRSTARPMGSFARPTRPR